MRILITGVGAPGTRGTMDLLQFNPEQRYTYTLGVDTNKYAAGASMCDAFTTVPPADHDEYQQVIASIVIDHGIDVIVPQTGAESLELSNGLMDYLSVAPMYHPQKLATDKWSFGLAMMPYVLQPKTINVHNYQELCAALDELGADKNLVFIKPREGNGSRGCYVVAPRHYHTFETLSRMKPGAIMNKWQLIETGLRSINSEFSYLIQEYLPGKEYSVDCFFDGKIFYSNVRERLKVANGIAFECKNVAKFDIRANCEAIARDLNMTGVFGFQFKEDAEGVPKLIECNPRVQGTMVASGLDNPHYNMVWRGIKWILGEDQIDYPIEDMTNKRFVRYWGGDYVG